LAADLNTTRTTATKLSTENKSLNEQQKKAEAEAQAARKELQAKVKEVEAAQTLLSNTEAKFKAAADVVAGVVAKLQEAKLIDPQAEPEAALKSLPDVLKKAVVLNKEPKLEELAAAVEKAELARNEAEQRVKKAEAELAAVRAETAKQVAAEIKKAIEATQAELARVKAERAAEVKRFQERLAAQEQQYQSQLTAARAGASVPFTSLERAAQDRARRAYASGLEAWRARQYDTAEAWFTQATKDDPADARYWYFAGLAKWAQGKQAEARKDFETGAEWEARSRPGRRQVGEALLLVQGPARAALDAYRP
jgi:colicin import membrane protein